MPVRTPGLDHQGIVAQGLRARAPRAPDVSGGTTLAIATPVDARTDRRPEDANRLRTRIPYSSAVCSRRVVSRQRRPQLGAVVDAEDGVGVADVDGQEQAHGDSSGIRRQARRRAWRRFRRHAHRRRARALGSRRRAEQEGAVVVDVQRQPADLPLAGALRPRRGPTSAPSACRHAASTWPHGPAASAMILRRSAGARTAAATTSTAVDRTPHLGARLVARSGAAGASGSTFTPMPTTTALRRRARRSTPRRGCRRACARPPARRSATSAAPRRRGRRAPRAPPPPPRGAGAPRLARRGAAAGPRDRGCRAATPRCGPAAPAPRVCGVGEHHAAARRPLARAQLLQPVARGRRRRRGARGARATLRLPQSRADVARRAALVRSGRVSQPARSRARCRRRERSG